ncbi:hypothetical protein BGX31_010725 [Mortierella sp. GBA43]|nr:hypothetical protein BGX31_010725 [Mortierella sp. GBA43]
MKLVMGIKDFGDQLMERGIFILVAGINGFVLVRQRVFIRQRQYEMDILQNDTAPLEFSSIDHDPNIVEDQHAVNPLEPSSTNQGKDGMEDTTITGSMTIQMEEYLPQDNLSAESTTMATNVCTPHESTAPGSNVPVSVSNSGEKSEDEPCSPEFRTMSFLAWFNYLQVGILVIEFLQLFSFPLRELMAFHKQTEEMTTMYESAKTVLGVLQAATSTEPRAMMLSNSSDPRNNPDLQIGNRTFSDLGFDNITARQQTESNNITAITLPSSSSAGNISSAISGSDLTWQRIVPLLENATSHPWTKNIDESMDWIAESLPGLLSNITALIANSSLTTAWQENLDAIHNHLVNAAASLAIQSVTLPGAASESESSREQSATKEMTGDSDIVMQVVNSLGLQPSINTHDWYLLRFWSCFLAVSILYLPILSTFLSSAACQSQAIYALGHERFLHQQEQAYRENSAGVSTIEVFSSIVITLLDPASTITPSVNSLLCTGPQIQPELYLAASLIAYTLAYLLFMVFLTSFERVPAKGEIAFRSNGVAVLKNLGLLLAVDFLLIQSPSQKSLRGLVSMAIMLAMACYTIRMKPCYWDKLNYWRTFSFSCVLYASLLVALLCPSPEPDKAKDEHIGGKWVMVPRLNMGHAWAIGTDPKVMLVWIVSGWVILVVVFVVADKTFLRHWTKNRGTNTIAMAG